MALFKKKKNALKDNGVSGALNPKTLQDAQGATNESLEEIVRTTDSMNVVAVSADPFATEKGDKLLELSDQAISRNFDLAKRRIAATHHDVIESGSYVGIPFLAIQVVISKYDKEWDVKDVEKVIEKFATGIIDSLSNGIGIGFSKQLVLEPVVYINKILPASKVTPSFASLANAVKWGDLLDTLIEQGALGSADREIIEIFVEALETNVNNGYYVQFGDLMVSRIRPSSADTILLYSLETLEKMNRVYKFEKAKKANVQVTRTNSIDQFIKTQTSVKAIKSQAKFEADMIKKEQATSKEMLKEVIKTNLEEATPDNEVQAVDKKEAIELSLSDEVVETKVTDNRKVIKKETKETKALEKVEAIAAKEKAKKENLVNANKKFAEKTAKKDEVKAAKKEAAKKDANKKKAPAKKAPAKKAPAKKATGKKTSAKK